MIADTWLSLGAAGAAETGKAGCDEPDAIIRSARHRRAGCGTADPDERDAEIERLLGLGARRVDIGQTGDESWTVLADPEGNEFCVVRPKTTLIG